MLFVFKYQTCQKPANIDKLDNNPLKKTRGDSIILILDGAQK